MSKKDKAIIEKLVAFAAKAARGARGSSRETLQRGKDAAKNPAMMELADGRLVAGGITDDCLEGHIPGVGAVKDGMPYWALVDSAKTDGAAEAYEFVVKLIKDLKQAQSDAEPVETSKKKKKVITKKLRREFFEYLRTRSLAESYSHKRSRPKYRAYAGRFEEIRKSEPCPHPKS